ncbi:MAG: hypothetical protein JWR63_1934 [Conexibacter sp.]|nr:hypothetical protein [Conexibacter sp.]
MLRLAGSLWLLIAIAAPGAYAAAPKKKAVPAASAFKLPAAKACVAKRTLTIRLLKPRHVRWSRVTVTVGRKRVKTVKRPRSGASVKVAGLPSKGSYKLTITATDGHGRTATTTRTYRACAAKVVPVPGPPAAASPGPAAAGTPAPAPAVLLTPVSGSYAGGGLSLYVSRDAKQLQDVAAPAAGLTCTDGTTPTVQPVADELGLGADGSFNATVGRDGVVGGSAATLTYTFKGRFTTTTAVSGTWRVDVSGVGTSCTSGDQAWSATRTAQPTPQPAAAPPAGGYAGADGLALYVSSDAQQIQDVADASVDLQCTTGVDVTDHLAVDEIALAADGSLSASDTEGTIFKGKAAAATTTFRGHFHGTDADGNARAAGTWQRTITYDNGDKTCTSNPHPWAAKLAPQGSQANVPPTAGSYAGPGGVSLFVSAAGAQVQDVLVPATLRCDIAPPTDLRPDNHVGIDEIAIGLDGAFSATTTREGFFESAAATFTTTFKGHAHGTDAGGNPRLAGTWRETIVSNGGALTCASGDQPWSAVRETQPAQTAGAPPTGAWSGPNGQNTYAPLTFDVAAGGTQIQNVTAPNDLDCDGGSSNGQLDLASVPIAGDGSFSATVTPPATPGDPVFTYTFRGHFHATGPDGKARAAGTWREDFIYDDGAGTITSCSSNDQSWSAKAP